MYFISIELIINLTMSRKYSNHPAGECFCLPVCHHHLISETTRFHYPAELFDGWKGYEGSELQRFCSKNVSLRRYWSFNVLFVLHHLELLTSTKKITKTNYAISLSKSLRVVVPV